jgi:tellurite resistance protein TerC
MYFLLAGMHERFHLLSYGLAAVLVFIGAKMLLLDLYKIPITVSLLATLAILATSIVLSLAIPARHPTSSAYPFGAKKAHSTSDDAPTTRGRDDLEVS